MNEFFHISGLYISFFVWTQIGISGVNQRQVVYFLKVPYIQNGLIELTQLLKAYLCMCLAPVTWSVIVLF